MAGGFSIKIENIEKFKEFIFKKYKKTNKSLSINKSLYLDCVIAPTALNIEFYKKIKVFNIFFVFWYSPNTIIKQ